MSSLNSNFSLASKFRGCLMGSLVGDCIGAPYEFSEPTEEVMGRYFSTVLKGELRQKGHYPYTDDTAMTISIAESLLEKQKVCSLDIAKRFVTDYFRDPNRCYGYHVRTVFKDLRDTDFKDVFLPAKSQFDGMGSYGNGAAMRISPVALFTHDKDDQFLKNAVEQCSFVTHTHADGANGAILECLAIQAALKLDPTTELNPVEFIDQLENKMKVIETQDNMPYCESLNKIREIYIKKREDISAEDIREYLGNDEIAVKSVPTAVYCFLRGLKPIPERENLNSFMRAIYFATLVGGDADTIACMAGSIAGAYYGIEAIPEIVQKNCECYEKVSKLSENLFNMTCKQPET